MEGRDIDFHLDRGSIFHTSLDVLIDDLLYTAYKLWETEFEKRPKIPSDGLLRKAMENDEDLTWNYDNSWELRKYLNSVLANAMVNHDRVAEFAAAVKSGRNPSVVLEYEDHTPMKDSDISLLLEFYESGAFDKVGDDLEDDIEEE